MKGKERNAFEKELQKDPFSSEAAEGFSMITPEEAEKDLNEIGKRLKARSRRKMPVIFLRIAAVITILLATTFTLMIVRNDHKQPLVSENIKPESKEKALEIAAAPSITRPAIASTDRKPTQTEKEVNKLAGIRFVPPVATDTATEKEAVGETDLPDIRIAALEDQRLSNFRLMEEMETREKAKSIQKRSIEGTVISTDDNLPLPGVSIVIKGTSLGAVTDVNGYFSINVGTDSSLMLVANFVGMQSKEFSAKPDTNLLIAMNADMMALDEVVVVGYGISRKESVSGAVATINNDDKLNTNDYNPPEPVAGFTGFKSYVELNLRYPENVAEKTRKIVVLSMIIRYNGTPDSIRIVKSPGKDFSDEAIRLIKEGPAWKPAMVNGITKEEEVKVRIVFDSK